MAFAGEMKTCYGIEQGEEVEKLRRQAAETYHAGSGKPPMCRLPYSLSVTHPMFAWLTSLAYLWRRPF
jgi:hypothetical protein